MATSRTWCTDTYCPNYFSTLTQRHTDLPSRNAS